MRRLICRLVGHRTFVQRDAMWICPRCAHSQTERPRAAVVIRTESAEGRPPVEFIDVDDEQRGELVAKLERMMEEHDAGS